MTIKTLDQFESLLNLFGLLGEFNIRSSHHALQDLLDQEGDEWEVCHRCGELTTDCNRECNRHTSAYRGIYCEDDDSW